MSLCPRCGRYSRTIRWNRLVNITLYNVVMRGNSGHGISMPTNGLSKLRAAPLKSSPAFAPSSFVFENLLIDGGGEGGIYWCAPHLPVYCLCPALPCDARTSVAKSSLGSVCRDNMGEKTAAGQLLVRNATIRATQQAGLQVKWRGLPRTTSRSVWSTSASAMWRRLTTALVKARCRPHPPFATAALA
jgi:hypothetical protein